MGWQRVSPKIRLHLRYDLPHRDDPYLDLDLASYGIVSVLEDGHGDTYPDMPWEPKAAFRALGDYYRE